jgi:hypothetical protein
MTSKIDNAGLNMSRQHRPDMAGGIWAEHTVAERKTQATNLPNDTLELPNMERSLILTIKTFDVWQSHIEAILEERGILSIISYNIPRPIPTDEGAARWRLISMKVANWLMINVSESLYHSMKNSKKRYTFADETYKAISEECVDFEVQYRMLRASHDVVVANDIIPDNYYTEGFYIDDYDTDSDDSDENYDTDDYDTDYLDGGYYYTESDCPGGY